MVEAPALRLPIAEAPLVQEPARRQRGQPVGEGVGDRSGMADLRRDRGTLRVHGIGEPAKSGHGLGPHVDLVALGTSFRRDGAVGDRGHADTAGRGTPVAFDQFVADQGAGSDPLESGHLDDSVAQGEGAEPGRAGPSRSGI